MDSAQSLAIGAVTIDPADPTIVFVGTGEGNLSGDSFFGVGLYRIANADSSPVLNGPFETRIAGSGTTASNGHAFLGTSINKNCSGPRSATATSHSTPHPASIVAMRLLWSPTPLGASVSTFPPMPRPRLRNLESKHDRRWTVGRNRYVFEPGSSANF